MCLTSATGTRVTTSSPSTGATGDSSPWAKTASASADRPVSTCFSLHEPLLRQLGSYHSQSILIAKVHYPWDRAGWMGSDPTTRYPEQVSNSRSLFLEYNALSTELPGTQGMAELMAGYQFQ